MKKVKSIIRINAPPTPPLLKVGCQLRCLGGARANQSRGACAAGRPHLHLYGAWTGIVLIKAHSRGLQFCHLSVFVSCLSKENWPNSWYARLHLHIISNSMQPTYVHGLSHSRINEELQVIRSNLECGQFLGHENIS